MKLRSSKFPIYTTITLVLFLIGCLGILLLIGNRASSLFKESIVVNVFFNDNSEKKDIDSVIKEIKKDTIVSRTQFISKEEVAEVYSKELGEDFIDLVGVNPLPNLLKVYFKPENVGSITLHNFKVDMEKNIYVEEVKYNREIINILETNIKQIAMWISLASIIFLIISIILINSSIKVSIYSKRFIIYTMQLVGATRWFVQRPFLAGNIAIGLWSGLIANVLLVSLIYSLKANFPNFNFLDDTYLLILIFISIIIIGILICIISTLFATNKFLRLKYEDLHY